MFQTAKFTNVLKSKVLPVVTLILALLGLVFHRTFKSNWVYSGNVMPILFIAMVVVTCFIVALTWLRLNNKSFCEKKLYVFEVIISFIIVTAYFIYTLIVVYSGVVLNSDNREIYLLNLQKTLSKGAVIAVIPFLLLFFPKLGNKAKKIVTTIILAVVILFCVNDYFSLIPHKITSKPMVVDSGNGYSIVFSTNDEGAGYVTYTYNGVEYKVYDQTGGRVNAGRIHSVNVPYEHLKNNTYTVSSYRVIEEFSYGSRIGKTITSEEYTLVVNESEEQDWLVLSDWHNELDIVYDTIRHLGEYDSVILLGDSTIGLDYEEQAINNIVIFGGEVSQGTKPVLFARGNHETRGAYADQLQDALGLDSWYYTSDIGPYSFVILDSGEDKPDSHIEYGGMADYATYRAQMIDWLKSVNVNNEKVIAISHAWEISEVEEELSDAGFVELDRLGTRLLLSGHFHQCRFLGEADDREKEVFAQYPKLIGYLDGGKLGSGEDYIASKLRLSDTGFTISAVDMAGNILVNETFDWEK